MTVPHHASVGSALGGAHIRSHSNMDRFSVYTMVRAPPSEPTIDGKARIHTHRRSSNAGAHYFTTRAHY
jgi:hypothetical protein